MENTTSKLPNTTELLITNQFYDWQGKKNESMALNDPERFSRCLAASRHAEDGSTHAENIEDMREYASELHSEIEKEIDDNAETDEDLKSLLSQLESDKMELDADIDRLEKWHEENGSLENQA